MGCSQYTNLVDAKAMHQTSRYRGHHHIISKCNLTIVCFNARSLLPKFDYLSLSVDILRPHIICLVETWLSDEISDNKITINDRNRHGGGVLMYVSMFFASVVLPSPHSLEIPTLSVTCD